MNPLNNFVKSNLFNQLIGVATQHASALKTFIGKGDVSAASLKPSSISASQTNQQAVSSMKTAFQNSATVGMAAAEEASVGVAEAGGPFALLRIPKKETPEKKEGRTVSREEAEGLFEELANELSSDADAGGSGGGGAGEEGAGGKSGGDRRTAGGQQIAALLQNLDPNKPIQDQMDEYLTDPAWKTESGQAKAAQFIFDHLDKIKETALVNRVKAHVDQRTEEAVRKALKLELEEGGVSTEEQDKVGKVFHQYFSLVSMETTTPLDEIKFMGEQVSGLPSPKGKTLPESFRLQLQHEIGLSMRKLDTFDDRAQFLVCNSAIRLTRGVTLLFKDFEDMTPRLQRQGLTQLASYAQGG